jgi:hypothetical protein
MRQTRLVPDGHGGEVMHPDDWKIFSRRNDEYNALHHFVWPEFWTDEERKKNEELKAKWAKEDAECATT